MGEQRLRSLFALLSPPERRLLAAASAAHAIERVGVVAATASVAFSGVRDGVVVALALGAVFFTRGVLGSTLRMRVRSRTLETLAGSLLSDTADVTVPVSDEAELALMEGLFATETILGDRLPNLIGDGVACLVSAAVVVWLEPPTVVAMAGIAIVVGGILAAIVRRSTAASSERQWKALVPVLDDLSNAIQGRLEIVGNGDATQFMEGVAIKLAEWRRRSIGAGWVSVLAGRAPVVGAAIVVGLFVFSAGGWGNEAIARAAILASVTPAFAGLARGVLDLGRDRVRAGPVIACLEESRMGLASGTRPPSLPATIACTSLSFTYPGDARPTLADVDVILQPETLVALAGQNGSGKSTFVRLLLGLHAPSQGTVSIGDVPLADLDKAALRRRVGYLAQRPFLPDRMTVVQAIQLLAPEATASAIESMLTRLGLFPVLARRNASAPLDVKLGALSAGEKQRVAIARVLLRDAPLLLLDEPDTNLDAEGVTIVKALLREEAKTRMVLVIAHSPVLLEGMGRVIRFEDGRVSDS